MKQSSVYLLLIWLAFWVSMGALPSALAQESTWIKELPGVGTFSSPRATDLNGDGVKDIVLGAGRVEFIACDSAVVALDGKTGDMLWNVGARDQVFGSANLKDLNGDGVDDVLINGRSAELKAINGKTGEVLWEFFTPSEGQIASEAGWFNFYNAQFIPDQNNDGMEDILVSNGGDVMVEPYDPDRPAGNLLVISSLTGELLAKAMAPDGKEIYMSVIVRQVEPDGPYKVVFGTGGETIGGNLFVTTLADVMNEDLSQATKLATSPNKGFIAPPVWVEITGDTYPDIVASAVDGRVLAFDGHSLEPLWSTTLKNTEIYSSLAPGYFTEDEVPDFFLSVAQGTWPKLEWNKQFMINGLNGQIEYVDSMGFYQTSTAVVLDADNDGRDEALLSINYQELNQLYQKFFRNMLIMIDFETGAVDQMGRPFKGNNISTTPWIGDLDDDGYMDLIYCHGTNERHTYTFDGLKVHRISTDIRLHKPIKWGAYMGSAYNGSY